MQALLESVYDSLHRQSLWVVCGTAWTPFVGSLWAAQSKSTAQDVVFSGSSGYQVEA